ncbi:MAG: DUF6544 family protein [Sandaracinaceae bacterium]
MGTPPPSLDRLWDEAPLGRETFDPAAVASLPEEAAAWLRRAIAPGTRLYRAARLTMHGEIRLGGDWLPFEAEEVLGAGRGFRWSATTRMRGLPLSGYDLLWNGRAEMRWRAFSLLPVLRASGHNVSRSALGRLHLETIAWLPTALVGQGVAWSEAADGGPAVKLFADGTSTQAHLTVEDGRLRALVGGRWGGPTGDAQALVPFGGEVLTERTFSGVTVPTELELGWFYGEPRFAEDGLFFKATVDDVRFK